eukprot:6855136-Lingulodinium_polyedra.AAC.1
MARRLLEHPLARPGPPVGPIPPRVLRRSAAEPLENAGPLAAGPVAGREGARPPRGRPTGGN